MYTFCQGAKNANLNRHYPFSLSVDVLRKQDEIGRCDSFRTVVNKNLGQN